MPKLAIICWPIYGPKNFTILQVNLQVPCLIYVLMSSPHLCMKMYDFKTCDFTKKGHFSLHGTQIKIAVLNGRGQGNMNVYV